MNPAEWANFLRAHRERHRFARLPNPDDDASRRYYDVWRKAAAARGVVDSRFLDAASERLVMEPPPSAAKHLETLLTYAVAAQREAGIDGAATTDTREAAEAASRGCEYCSASGLTSVYHPKGGDPVRRLPASVAAHCVCRVGRLIRRGIGPDDRKRFVDLADVLAGRSVWQLNPPWFDTWAPAFSGEQTVAEMIRDLTRPRHTTPSSRD